MPGTLCYLPFNCDTNVLFLCYVYYLIHLSITWNLTRQCDNGKRSTEFYGPLSSWQICFETALISILSYSYGMEFKIHFGRSHCCRRKIQNWQHSEFNCFDILCRSFYTYMMKNFHLSIRSFHKLKLITFRHKRTHKRNRNTLKKNAENFTY